MQFRADQVGSLLRPPQLLEARTQYMDGQRSLDSLRAIEDEAILEALEQQRQAGIDVFTDGEYRRFNFYSHMIEAVDGFVSTDEEPLLWRGGSPAHNAARIVGARLQQRKMLTEHEIPFLKEHAPGPIKATLPSAMQFFRSYRPGISDRFYATRAELGQELAGILHREIEALIAGGIPYIQIDAPSYTALVDPSGRERLRASGVDPDEALSEAIAADNASVAGLRGQGSIIALHLCRGNSRSRWLSEGSYEPIAERLFNELDVDRLLLEYDTERAGGFEPLRFMPSDKEVVLGLITTKSGELEPVDDLIRRVDAATAYVAADRLGISPQCGFASAMAGNLLSTDDQRRKLELVRDVARQVWG